MAEEEIWFLQIHPVQFAINNVISKGTGKAPSQLMFRFTSRHNSSDAVLSDELNMLLTLFEDLIYAREQTVAKKKNAQVAQKYYFDKKRKSPKIYWEGNSS
ncbi:hypothetical protein YQE_05994, partial [Dendroctonus ponderosae]